MSEPARRRFGAILLIAALLLGLTFAVAAGAKTPAAATASATTNASAGTAASATGATSSSAGSTAAARAAAAVRIAQTLRQAKGVDGSAAVETKANSAANANAAKPQSLTGWLAPLSATFPERALVLSPSPHVTLSASSLTVTENGLPVTSLHLTPLAAAQPGDFATVIVIDQSTGANIAAEMAAARALAAHRAPGEAVGVVSFDSRASTLLPLTDDAAKISDALASTPRTGKGADLAAGEATALLSLSASHTAAGAVVVISDGAGLPARASGSALTTVKSAAAAAHVPVVTVGLRDRKAKAASLRTLAASAPGPSVNTKPASAATAMAGVAASVADGYVLRYRSLADWSTPIAVSVSADGVYGTLGVSYRSPAAPVVHHAAPVNPRAQLSFSPAFAQRTALAPTPSFASATLAVSAAPPAPATPAPGFWASPAAVPAIAVICSLLIALAIALAFYQPSRRAVRLRVGSFIPTEPEPVDQFSPNPAETEVKGPFASLARSNWWPPFVEAVEISRSPHSPVYLVKRAAAIAAVAAVILTVISGMPLLGLAALILWPFPLRTLVYRAANKQREKFRDTLPIYLQDLASAIRVGRSFVGALGVVGEGAEEPTRSEFERAATDEALGRPLEESLEAVSRRMQSNDMDQVALIAALNRKSGSNVAEALDRVAEGARDRADLRREIRALTAQAKLSSTVLTALPGVLLAGLSVLSPQYSHPLFHTTLGIVSMVIGAGLVVGGWKVMQKITRVEA